MKLSFQVSTAPVPKGRARVTRWGTYTPKRVRAFELLVRAAAAAAIPARWPLDHPAGYRVRVAVYRGSMRGDLDNFCKSVTDACNAVVYRDDSSIVEIHALRFDDKDNPRIMVEIDTL